MLRFLTAGESHGPALTVIIDGIPANLKISTEAINKELSYRQKGYGRSQRQKIERDRVEIISGLRGGKTIGSPISFLIENKDWKNWQEIMSIETSRDRQEKLTSPRPGHADLAGLIKYHQNDIRNILERASARETAARVGAGAICKILLKELGQEIMSFVTSIGGVEMEKYEGIGLKEKEEIIASKVHCPDKKISKMMISEINRAKEEGDTLGGTFVVKAISVPPGLGGYTQWDRRMDTKISAAMMSIPGVKGVEIGGGFSLSSKPGSEVQDEIFYSTAKGFYRKSNFAGGIEGGITNGQPLIVKAAMKPISTLGKPVSTMDFISKKKTMAIKERADVCAVPSAAVIGEAVMAIEIAMACLEKFGSDSMEELKMNYENYLSYIKKL